MKGRTSRYDWNAAEEQASKGKLPPPPDFSAPTHDPFRDLFAKVCDLAKNKQLDALRRVRVQPKSSSRRIIARYRNLCIKALALHVA